MKTCVEQLIAVIELILHYHEFGLRVLTGDVEPTAGEIDSILRLFNQADELPTRVAAAFPSSPQERGVIRVEYILDIVAQAGGWTGIAKMAAEFRSFHKKTWDVFRTHVEWISGSETRIESDSILTRIADKFGISVDTVQRTRRFVVYQIASATLRTDRVLIDG